VSERGATDGWTLRGATLEDAERIAQIWHAGWRDGHLGHVPEALLPHRRLEHFRERVPPRIPATTVAVTDGELVGFVTIHDAEVEQLFVDAKARGRGIADALLRHAEERIAARFETAWLAVVEGNRRARRFYERCGWRDIGGFDYQAEIEGGRLAVPSRRYEKCLAVR
jgi:ribosomal protein S18 acetylase RimI-like enzyme